MDTQRSPNRDSLDVAREASRNGDHALALQNYQYFFEHALDGDSASLYGVRLSYCLAEWAKLGRMYLPAHEALEERRVEALRRLESTREPENFHDYEAISRYLDVHDDAVRQFLHYHRSDRDLASSIMRFVWTLLVSAGAWEVCYAYLGDAGQRYSKALAKFDEAIQICRENPDFGGAEFEQQIHGWYVRDVGELVLVLKNNGRIEDAKTFHAQAERDIELRGYPELSNRISSEIAL